MLSITLILIIITSFISVTAFSQRAIIDQLIFDPVAITQQHQWWRFFTCGFIHADWEHLLFNMLSLYLFGNLVEPFFQTQMLFAEKGAMLYVLLYISTLFLSLLPTYLQHKNNRAYRSLGASGAVSAIVFVGILFNPTARMGFFLIPPIIPGYIFGPIYLLISAWLQKRGADRINHSAHISGALAGILVTCLLAWWLQTEYQPWKQFLIRVSNEF